MKLTRILSLLLALLTVASLLCACKPEEAETPDDTTTVDPNATTSLSLIVNGETDYVIVRDYQASEAVISAVQALATSIQKNIGATVQIKECFNNREEESDVKAAKEILVGMTNREESINTLSTMRSKDYTICEKNGKMVIGGGGDDGTLTAITRFINDFVVEQGNPFAVKQGAKQNLIFSSDKTVSEVGSYSYTSAHIMGVSLDNFGIIYPKNGSNSELYKTFAGELSSYISAQSGYQLPTMIDATNWCDYEIRIGYAEGNADKHEGEDGCCCRTLASNEYSIKLIKTQVTYEDGSKHDGARLYICFGASAKDAAMKAFSGQIMPILKEQTAFTMDEGFELNNFAS